MEWNNQRVGILGGGQLGAMLIRPAIDFGLHVSVLDIDPAAPCARYASAFHLGDPLCYETVLEFGRSVDVLTIEKEAVNVQALRVLEAEGIQVHPSAEVIGIIQDKWTQKSALRAAGIPVVPGFPVQNREDLRQHLDKLPGCLKRCTSGYDGNGVMILHSAADVDSAFDAPCVLEELVDISQELSVIVSRNANGDVQCYDPVLMMFDKERMLLDFQLCPANIPPAIADEAANLSKRIAETIGLVGILAVEMFITSDGRLLVNELAPRPHNSGHHTIEACATSQYEQLLRTILGLPLGDTRTTVASAMINVLEPAAARRTGRQYALRAILGLPDAHLHLYGKTNSKEGRKVGHVTITAETVETALSKAVIIRQMLRESGEQEINELIKQYPKSNHAAIVA